MTFIEKMFSYGKQISIRLTMSDGKVFEKDDVYSCTRNFDGDMFKTFMSYIDVEMYGLLDIRNKEVSVEFGVKVKQSDLYEYINWGTFIIDNDTIKKSIDKNKTSFTAYDYLAKACVSYEDIGIVYPITIKNYLAAICNHLGLQLQTSTFVNSAQQIKEEKFLNVYDYTYRDVLDQIAGAAGGIIVAEGNKLLVKYPTDTGFIIDENNLKSLSINEKWGPVNSIVLSLMPQNDNYDKKDDVSIATNGLTEIKIENNELMNKSRELFIGELFNKLNGFYFYPFELESFGYGIFKPYDIVTIKDLDGVDHKCLIICDEVSVTSGIKEKLSTEMPEVAVTDYSKSTSSEKKLYKTLLEVDKQNQKITLLVASAEEKLETIDLSTIQLNLIKTGTLLNKDITKITLSAQIMQGAQDITSTISNISFTWQRSSSNVAADTTWNNAHKGVKTVNITTADVDTAASFQCTVTTAVYTKRTGFETIVDETDIAHLSLQFDSNKPLTQSFDKNDGTLYPSWNPLIVTPIVWDGVLDIKLSECEISWARIDGVLQAGEIVSDGLLKVSQNKLSEATGGMITYVCTAKYRTQTISNKITYTLVSSGTDGKPGNDGLNGLNGKTLYTWIKYADDASGAGLSDVPTGKKYMGVSYNNESATESTNPADYSWSLIKGADGVGLSTVEVYYYLSTSNTTQAGGSWSTTAPVWVDGKYMWQKTKTTLSNGTSKESTPICVTGGKGETGGTGGQGAPGVGIKSSAITYQASTSGTTVPTGSWTTTIPSVAANQYLWTRTVLTMTDNTTSTGYAISKIGNDGKDGTDGKGIKSTAVTYQASTSGTTVPTGTWSASVPSVAANQYLWTRTVITYTDNATSTSYSIGLMGGTGPQGATGATGKGVSSITAEYYLSTSKTAQAGGSWVTTSPAWSSGKYVWTRSKITYTDGTVSYTAPLCDSSWEAVNELEIGGTNIAIGTNQGGSGWYWSMEAGGSTKTEVDENGIRCVKFVRDAAAQSGWSYIGYTNINRIKYLPNKQYTIAFDVKASVVASFKVWLVKGDGTSWLNIQQKTDIDTVPDVWTRVQVVITTIDPLPTATGQLLYMMPSNSKPGVSYMFRNLIISEGNKRPPWSPAPEDIQAQIDATVSQLDDIASDSKLTPSEKTATKKEWLIIVDEYAKYNAQATTYSVSATAYASAYSALNTYLNATSTGLLYNMSTTSDIVRLTFTNNFKAYYNARVDLMSAIELAKAKKEVSDLEIGGRNLLRFTDDLRIGSAIDPSNATGINKWSGAAGTLENTTDGLKLTRNNNSNDSFWVPIASLGCVENGETITLSFKYRTNTTNAGGFYFIQSSGANRSVTMPSLTISETEWKEYKWTFSDVQANIRLFKSVLLFYGPSATGQWIEIKKKSLKLEKGEKALSWSPAIEDTDDKINNDIADATAKIKTDYETYFKNEGDALVGRVNELETTVGDQAELIKKQGTVVKQTSDDYSIVKETTSTLTDLVTGKVDEVKLKEWARFDGATLELGKDDSQFKAILSNTELAFMQGTTKVAWISNNELHIANSVIMEILRVGNWQCCDEGSAGLTWRKI